MAWDYVNGEPVWVDESIPLEQDSPVPVSGFNTREQNAQTYPAPDSAEIQMPEDVIRPAPPISTETGTSISQRGFQPDTFNYLETKGKTGINRELADAENKRTAEANNLASGFNAAAQENKQAVTNLGELEANKTSAESQLRGEQARMLKQHAIESDADYTKAFAKAEQYKGEYETQLKQLSQMTVNPGRLYSNMTTGEKGATLISAFVTDFLGAKGIKTSAMDTYNRAVDRDIDSQVQAIQTKGRVAEGFKALWGMQREQSSSDYEAKLRMKGMMMEAFKTEVAAKLGQFDSDIARAKIPLALAQIDEQSAKTKTDLYKIKNDQFNSDAQRLVAIRSQNITASIASNELAFKKKQAELAAKGTSAYDPHLFIRDSQGNVINQAPDKETRKEVQDKVVAYEGHIRKLDDLTASLREVGKVYGGPLNKLVRDTETLKYESKYNALLKDIIKAASGVQASDLEVQRLKKVLPFSDFATGIFSGDDGAKSIERVYADYGLDNIKDLEASVLSAGIPVPPELAEQYKGGITSGSLETTKAHGINLDKIASGKDKPVNDEIEQLKKTAGSSLETTSGVANSEEGNIYDDALDFFTERGDLTENKGGDPVWKKTSTATVGTATGNLPLDETIPDWFGAMDKLKDKAVGLNATKDEYDRIKDYFYNITLEPQAPLPFPQDTTKSDAAMYFLMELENTGYRGE